MERLNGKEEVNYGGRAKVIIIILNQEIGIISLEYVKRR